MSRIHSISDLKFIKPPTLYTWITKNASPHGGSGPLAIIDVRESDYMGGHIKGSWHYPAGDFYSTLPEIYQKIYRQKIHDVVFHCMLSQSRGPSSTLKFLRSIDEIKDEKVKSYLENEVHVYVLKGGFNRWQGEYGKNANVTEGYNEELWAMGL
ncbi:ibp1 [Candida margitis]|uniref:ibp1 n=1 Tax=Candida margitis TaxID=1775924 RepID=UPI002225CC40|nr:ibp1 [Candida margitis]KAI5952074.1 ibp1 [Candida margitis]